MKSSNGLYEAVIVVRGRTETEATEVTHNGSTYIEGREGSEYTLRFRNLTGERVLVVPSVDGLSVIDGKPAGLNSDGYLIEAHGSVDVPGWLVDSTTAAKFVFTKKGGSRSDKQTYAETRGTDPNNIGIIGFAVFKEKVAIKQVPIPTYIPVPYPVTPAQPWPIWNGYPYYTLNGVIYSGTSTPFVGMASGPLMNQTYDSMDAGADDLGVMGGAVGAAASNVVAESNVVDSKNVSLNASSLGSVSGLARSLGSLDSMERRVQAQQTASPPLGTGFGDATNFNTTSVSFEKQDQPDAIITLIYDSLINLAKMGVPVEKLKPVSPVMAPRNAFPASPNACQPPAGWRK